VTGSADENDRVLPANAIRAVRLSVAAIILSAMDTVRTLTDHDSLERRVGQGNPPGVDVDSLVDLTMVSAVLVWLLATALWLGLIAAVRANRNWRRSVTGALAATPAALLVIALSDHGGAYGAMVFGAWGVATIGMIMLLAIRLFTRSR
jgi:hypothetical protein